MPFIDDDNCLDLMAEVEGAEWRRQQEANRGSPYGFFAYLEAWRLIKAEPALAGERPYDVISMGLVPSASPWGDGAIYGEGGYSRYVVGSDGRVHLLTGTNPTREARARELGF